MHVVTILSLVTCVLANFEDDLFAGNDPKDNYFRYVRTYAQSDYADNEKLTSPESGDIPKPFGFRIYYPENSKRTIRTRREQDTPPALVGIQTTTVTTEEETDYPVLLTGKPPQQPNDDLMPFDEELKPLELDVLEINSTDSFIDTNQTHDQKQDQDESTDQKNDQNQKQDQDEDPEQDLVINDFIRFKRDVETNSNLKNQESVKEKEDGTREEPKFEESFRPKREHERTREMPRESKMLLSPGESLPEGGTGREPRGAVKEQWVKQPYQVQGESSNRNNYDDLAREPPNAPRVHFVTQRRSESVPPLVYHSYERDRERERGREREGRSRDLTRQRDIDLERDFDPAYYPRPPRHYNAQVGDGYPRRDAFYNERDSRHRDFDRERERDRDFIPNRSRGRFYANQDRYYEEDRPIPAYSKQKRIIYYATLPDITKTNSGLDRERDRDRDRDYFRRYRPDSGDNYPNLERERDRERDRDRDIRPPPSENRYAAQPIGDGPSGAINYRFRNESPYETRDKSRYDEATAAKAAPYPTKVSTTDVNVRSLKKNPERRIYSEVERRGYPYKATYHHDDGISAYDANHR